MLGSFWNHSIACAIDVLFRGARKRVPSTLTLSFDWPWNETRSFIAYSIFDLIWIRVATLMDATKGWCVEHTSPQSSETSKPSLETSRPSPEISKPSPEMAAAASAAANSRNRRPLRTFVETLRLSCILELFWFWSTRGSFEGPRGL